MKRSLKFCAALGAALLASSAANAGPVTQFVGNTNISGTDYAVSVLGDDAASGISPLQSFNALNPTITFTTSATAIAAANALITAFGIGYDWQPWNSTDGGRIVYSNVAGSYDYVTIALGGGLHGPFSQVDSGSNAYTFIQFVPTSAVPEPMTLSLFFGGFAGVAALRKRRKA